MVSSWLLLPALVLTLVLPLVISKKCPNATTIAPCTCTYVNALHTILDLDCSQGSDLDTLTTILAEEFPNRSFRHFSMTNSPIKILPADMFGSHRFDQFKFETVDISNSALEEIEEGVFEHSTDTLLELNLSGCQLISTKIPVIDNFEVLWKLQLQGNSYTSLDPIESGSLVDLTLGSPALEEVPQFATWNIPLLQTLDIRNSPNLNIQPNSFESLENLHWLSLVDVGLTELTEGMITWSSTISDGNSAVGVHLDDNHITTVDPGAIQGSIRTFVSLRNNALTTLDEEVWKPILDLNGSLDAEGVQLPCDCTIAWVMDDYPTYLYHIYNAACDDGTPLINLSPMAFADCP